MWPALSGCTASVVGVLSDMPRDYRLVVVTSSPDLWTGIAYDWHRPVVLPTLPVERRAGRAHRPVVTDAERRERLAFAIRAAMGKRTAQQIADSMNPTRSKETVARWARGETVPSALDIGPLAAALGVRIELLVSPPELPTYPLDDYLLDAAGSGVEEGIRRARARPAGQGPDTPAQSPEPRPRGTRAGHG
jgi:transcriptional regulator with XRE-family HTH domain